VEKPVMTTEAYNSLTLINRFLQARYFSNSFDMTID
jgi:hypothetical protein